MKEHKEFKKNSTTPKLKLRGFHLKLDKENLYKEEKGKNKN